MAWSLLRGGRPFLSELSQRAPIEQSANPLALLSLAYQNVRERLRQKLVEPSAQSVHDDALAQSLGFNRIVSATVLEPGVVLGDDRQAVVVDLFPRESEPLPVQPRRGAFQNLAGVVLDVVAGEVEITKIENAVPARQDRGDVGSQKSAALAVRCRDPHRVVAAHLPQDASE